MPVELSSHEACNPENASFHIMAYHKNTIFVCLTHWGRVTHICVGKQAIIGSDNGLSPGRRQTIIWTNAGILLIEHLGTNFSEILIKSNTFSFKKMYSKMSSGKWRPFCLGLNVLTIPSHVDQLCSPEYGQCMWCRYKQYSKCYVMITNRNEQTELLYLKKKNQQWMPTWWMSISQYLRSASWDNYVTMIYRQRHLLIIRCKWIT